MRAGHTEAGCDLAELAGLTPAAVICEIMNPDGSMARMPELARVRRGATACKIGTIADLIHHRSENETLVERVADRAVATPYGPFRLCVYHDKTVDEVHYALVKGEPAPDRPMLVRVHEPFVSLDLFDFDTARHAYSVQDAMRIVAHHKEGVIVLLRRHEPAGEILERLARTRASAAPPASGIRACTASARRSCATWASARCACSRGPSASRACRASGSRWSSTSRPTTRIA